MEIMDAETSERLAEPFSTLLLVGHLKGEFEFRPIGGSSRTVDVSVVSLPKGLFLVRARDLTVERQLAEQARDAELRMIHVDRLSALGTMAAGIAHEINQPLNTIQVISSGLLFNREQGRPLREERLQESLETISRQVRRMSEIVEGIRRFTRREIPAQMESVDLNEVVRAALRMLGAQLSVHGIEVRTGLQEPLPRVRASFNLLEQVFVNLVNNARDAMDGCDPGKPRVLRVETRGEAGSVALEVADTGPGLSKAARENLFVPYFTTKEPGQGTGLGLAISLTIAKDYGGTLETRNPESGGAAFTLRLPAAS
jgi:C4-dicarboxylate-specific signal transduction histidine kinase